MNTLRWLVGVLLINCIFTVQAKEKIIIAVQSFNAPPYIWHTNDGGLHGYVPHIYREIADSLGYQAEFVVYDFFDMSEWITVVDHINSDEIHLAGPMLKPYEGFKSVAAGKESLVDLEHHIYMVSKDDTSHNRPLSFDELANLKGGALAAASNVIEGQITMLNLRYEQRLSDLFIPLIDGDLDYLFLPKHISKAFIFSQGMRGKFYSFQAGESEPFYIVGKKGHEGTGLLHDFDLEIAKEKSTFKSKSLLAMYSNLYIDHYAERRVSIED